MCVYKKRRHLQEVQPHAKLRYNESMAIRINEHGLRRLIAICIENSISFLNQRRNPLYEEIDRNHWMRTSFSASNYDSIRIFKNQSINLELV